MSVCATGTPMGGAAAADERAAVILGMPSISNKRSPADTGPGGRRRSRFKPSIGVTRMGVIKLLAPWATTSRSKRMSSSPARTIAPGRTLSSNPRPPKVTVSMPMWINTSTPSAARIDTAWELAGRVTISPAQGARTRAPVGSMARPSPSMRPANTGSGTVSSASHQPSKGARIRTVDIRRLLPDLNPVERPHRIEPRTREAQAQIMPSREGGQALRRQRGHAGSVGRRRQWQEGKCRRAAPVHMNLELALGCASVAHPYLGCIRTDLVIKRQRRDRGNDARSLRQVDPAIHPARVHDVDGERPRLVAARQQQQADPVAAWFEIVTVAAQYRTCIQPFLPGARSLFGPQESGGANQGALR